MKLETLEIDQDYFEDDLFCYEASCENGDGSLTIHYYSVEEVLEEIVIEEIKSLLLKLCTVLPKLIEQASEDIVELAEEYGLQERTDFSIEKFKKSAQIQIAHFGQPEGDSIFVSDHILMEGMDVVFNYDKNYNLTEDVYFDG